MRRTVIAIAASIPFGSPAFAQTGHNDAAGSHRSFSEKMRADNHDCQRLGLDKTLCILMNDDGTSRVVMHMTARSKPFPMGDRILCDYVSTLMAKDTDEIIDSSAEMNDAKTAATCSMTVRKK